MVLGFGLFKWKMNTWVSQIKRSSCKKYYNIVKVWRMEMAKASVDRVFFF